MDSEAERKTSDDGPIAKDEPKPSSAIHAVENGRNDEPSDGADVNENFVSQEPQTMPVEDKKTDWKKMTGKMKKRKYRTHSDGDNIENNGNKELTTAEMEFDCGNAEKNESQGTHDSTRHDSDNESVDEVSEQIAKSPSGNLKRLKVKSHTSAERKKRKKSSTKPKDDGDSGIQTSSEVGTSQSVEDETQTKSDTSDNSSSDSSESESRTRTITSSSSSQDSDDEEKENRVLTDDEVWLEKHTTSIGLPSWRAVKQLQTRECGCNNAAWQSRVCGSNGMVRRLEQQHTLDAHEGCVNALHFNQAGTLLASGSDDLDIHIWEWMSASQEPYISYNSGHRSNVFQAKFMPNSKDLTVVSCARDGQVRVGHLSSTGTCRDTKKIAQHRGSAHKLALDTAGCRSTFLSCGEDSVVMGFDLRENKPGTKLVSVKSGDSKVALYSIDASPRHPQQFAVSGRDPWARVYDRRMLDFDNPSTVAKYCPHHLQNAADMKANITCLIYNYDGSELLCSYNDEDIYLFDTTHSEGDDFVKKYKGHRNNATVKGVNFYGSRSEFIVSGSDCGNIFLWDRKSSKVVQFMQGDDGGVVNVLEPHPNLPVLATSGLDKNIKIWAPTGDGSMDEEKLKRLMLSNRQERHDESNDSNVIDSQLLWFLMRSLRNARSRRRMREGEEDNDDSSDSSSSDSSSNSDGDGEPAGRRRMDCLTS